MPRAGYASRPAHGASRVYTFSGTPTELAGQAGTAAPRRCEGCLHSLSRVFGLPRCTSEESDGLSTAKPERREARGAFLIS